MQTYLASVSFMDEQVGRVSDALDKSPHALNTINVLLSDHGIRSETDTGFLQIGFPAEHDLPRSLKVEAQLAAFLTKDPVKPEETARTFNDLNRRAANLKELLEHLKWKQGQRLPKKPHRPRFVY